MGGGSESRSRSSSITDSEEEDGDADWKAAIDSVATDFGVSIANGFTTNSTHSTKSIADSNRSTEEKQQKPQNLKLFQLKAQKLLEDLIHKSLEMVRNPIPNLDNDPLVNEDGIRLFKKAPPGIALDPMDEFQQPRKRPRILPGEEFDEKSKKFKRRLQSVAIDGKTIMAAARDACQKSLARFEAKNAAAKAAAKREEERVAELKRIRGEKWLPSIAREMKQIVGSRHKAM